MLPLGSANLDFDTGAAVGSPCYSCWPGDSYNSVPSAAAAAAADMQASGRTHTVAGNRHMEDTFVDVPYNSDTWKENPWHAVVVGGCSWGSVVHS